jgi:hypothetical protein
MSASNNEWIKILVSTIAGLSAGLIADPIKNMFQTRIAELRMRRSIVMDALNIHIMLKTVKQGLVSDTQFWRSLSLPAFDDHWAKNRDLFYRGLHLQTLRVRCELIKNLAISVNQGTVASEAATAKVRQVINEIIADNTPTGFRAKHVQQLFYKLFV